MHRTGFLRRRPAGGLSRIDRHLHPLSPNLIRPILLHPRSLLALLLLLALSVTGARAQRDTVTITAGPQYGAGAIHRTLFGSDYRDLWTTPVRIPVLDMESFAGGLRVERRGGGEQTRALRMAGADGREYNFRSVDKDAGRGLPWWLRGTPVEWALQDQTSSLHPAAAGIVASLLSSVGILHPNPRLTVLPDHPRLGEFREEFAGMLGWIEIHPDEDRDEPERGFAGAPRVVSTETLLEHLAEEPDSNRVDARAYLRVRLIDMLVGDWDRHEGQLRWAGKDVEGVRWWAPVPEDRDYAFVSYDGALTRAARWLLAPRARPYRAEYPPELFHLMKSGLELDRRLLGGLPPSAWDSVAIEVRDQLTDTAIDRALDTMPPAWHEVGAAPLAARLRARRDDLVAQAERFRELVMWSPADPSYSRSPR